MNVLILLWNFYSLQWKQQELILCFITTLLRVSLSLNLFKCGFHPTEWFVLISCKDWIKQFLHRTLLDVSVLNDCVRQRYELRKTLICIEHKKYTSVCQYWAFDGLSKCDRNIVNIHYRISEKLLYFTYERFYLQNIKILSLIYIYKRDL